MRRNIVAVFSLVAIAWGAAGTASAAAPQADEHRRIVSYWTAERRASAKPLDLVRPAPAEKPGGGGAGGGGATTTVTGATWTKGGPVTLTTGKVFFNLGASRYTCSASAVQTPAGNAVVTAGHCVHEGNGGAFATNWIFYPGWNGAPHPVLGAWTATDLFTTEGWAAARDFDDDAGFALLVGGAGKGSLAAELALLGATPPNIAFGTSTGAAAAFGYPASKKYKGNTLTYCAGTMRAGYDGNDTLALACDMTGGSSGGPWFQGPFDNDGTDVLISLNSYGYASVANTMFGPIFGTAEQAAYDAAASGAGCAGNGLLYRCA